MYKMFLATVGILLFGSAETWALEEPKIRDIRVTEEWSLVGLDIGYMTKHKSDMGIFPMLAIHKISNKDARIRVIPTKLSDGNWKFSIDVVYVDGDKTEVVFSKEIKKNFGEKDPDIFTGFPEDHQKELKIPNDIVEVAVPIIANGQFVVKAALISSNSKRSVESYAPIAPSYSSNNAPFVYRYIDL